MSLLWPGDHRAADVLSDAALLRALVRTEAAWLRVLVDAGVAPPDAVADLADVVGPEDLDRLAVEAEAGGNPVIPVVALLRSRLPEPARTWVHRGLTSQDVMDTALMLGARQAVAEVRDELTEQLDVLVALVEAHRRTLMTGRTLTQPATPIPFSAKGAGWLAGLLDADEALAALDFPVQLGGAAGTLSGLVTLAGPGPARDCRAALPRALGLSPSPPWHTRRTPVTRIGDALCATTDAWGRVAGDVLVLGRPEIGELVDGSGGGSSTMPHKANPTLAVLLHRTALTSPSLAAVLHSAAARQVDERADGAWHAEWEPLALLLRHTVTAGGQASALLRGLQVREDRMRTHVDAARDDLLAESRSMAEIAGREQAIITPETGLADDLVDEVLGRAARRTAPRRTSEKENT